VFRSLQLPPGSICVLLFVISWRYRLTASARMVVGLSQLFAGPTTWNSLPTHLRRVDNGTYAFGRLLKDQWLKWLCEAGGSPDEARLEQTPYPSQPH